MFSKFSHSFIGLKASNVPYVPIALEAVPRLLSFPNGKSDTRQSGRHGNDPVNTRHGASARIIKGPHFRSKNGSARNDRDQHPGHFDINAENGFPIHFV